MQTLPVSPEGQLVLPKVLPDEVGLAQRGAVEVRVEGGRIVLAPLLGNKGGWRRWEGLLAGSDALGEHVAEHRAQVECET